MFARPQFRVLQSRCGGGRYTGSAPGRPNRIPSSYYAYELEKLRRNGRSLRTEQTDDSPLGVSISASRTNNKLALTLVNPKHDTNIELSAGTRGARLNGGEARILHHVDMNACNTFQAPTEATRRVTLWRLRNLPLSLGCRLCRLSPQSWS